ncbi:MAG: hypothetical protein WCP85_27105 [Mariniphaga sp.]
MFKKAIHPRPIGDPLFSEPSSTDGFGVVPLSLGYSRSITSLPWVMLLSIFGIVSNPTSLASLYGKPNNNPG